MTFTGGRGNRGERSRGEAQGHAGSGYGPECSGILTSTQGTSGSLNNYLLNAGYTLCRGPPRLNIG